MDCTCPQPHFERMEHMIGCPMHEFPLTQAEIRRLRSLLTAADNAVIG